MTVESAAGATRGRAVLREGIRPDTVLLIGQFDHWATPVAKDLGLGSLNSLTSIALSLTDATGSGSDIARKSKIARSAAVSDKFPMIGNRSRTQTKRPAP